MSNHIESKMTLNGYEKVSGMAILNDVAVIETLTQVLTPKLSTPQAVDVFNNGDCGGWVLYRKRDLSLSKVTDI